MHDIFDRLKERLALDLPAHVAHERVAVPGREIRAQKMKANPRISAVLLLLYIENGILHFPLILRPQYDGVHGGQMALPGGGKEGQDTDLYDTAIRECQEEIGYAIPRTQILGELSAFYIPPSNSLVTPVVGYTYEKPSYNIDTYEVERVIEANIPLLRDPANFGQKQITIGNGLTMQAPAFMVGGQQVWGATAMILSEFLHVFQEAELQP